MDELTETLNIQHKDSLEAKVREMNKICSIQIDENTEKISKDLNNKVSLINTSWKLKCENEKKDQEAELNGQCLVEARAWADELSKKHKSRSPTRSSPSPGKEKSASKSRSRSKKRQARRKSSKKSVKKRKS